MYDQDQSSWGDDSLAEERRGWSGLAIAAFAVSFACGIAGLIMASSARGQIAHRNLHGYGFTTAAMGVSVGNLIMVTLQVILTLAAG